MPVTHALLQLRQQLFSFFFKNGQQFCVQHIDSVDVAGQQIALQVIAAVTRQVNKHRRRQG